MNPTSKVSLEDFKKVEITVGKIVSAEKIPETDKLLRLSVDFAEATPRQIISGIALHFPDASVLVGKKCMFITNLEPRVIRGFESNGMLLAVSTDLPAEAPARASHAGGSAQAGDGKFSLLEPSAEIPEGTKAK